MTIHWCDTPVMSTFGRGCRGVQARYYDWEHRRWISAKAYRAEWHPMEDYSRTYGGPTSWNTRLIAWDAMNTTSFRKSGIRLWYVGLKRTLAYILIDYGNPNVWEPIGPLLQPTSNGDSIDFHVFTGVIENNLCFFSIFEAILNIRPLTRETARWLHEWSRLGHECYSIRTRQNKYCLDSIKGLYRDGISALRPLRPLAAAALLPDMQAAPLSQEVLELLKPLLCGCFKTSPSSDDSQFPFQLFNPVTFLTENSESYLGTRFVERDGAHRRYLIFKYTMDGDLYTLVFRLFSEPLYIKLTLAVSTTRDMIN